MAESVYLDLRKNLFIRPFTCLRQCDYDGKVEEDKSVGLDGGYPFGFKHRTVEIDSFYAKGMSRDKPDVGQGLLVGPFAFATRSILVFLFLALFTCLSRR